MNVTKAKEILKVYQENGFNASKALPKVGYTKDTASKASKPIINRAIKVIATEQLKRIESSDNPMEDMFQLVGISKGDLIAEYTSVIRQNKDLSTKLKSMLPLLKELGLQWNEDKVDVKVPVLNIITKGSDTIPLNKDINSVAQSSLSDTDDRQG